MKKLLIAIAIVASILPIAASAAVTPGKGGEPVFDCVTSNNPNPSCADLPDLFKRVYQLEVRANQLEQQNADLQARLNAVQQPIASAPTQQGTDQSARIAALETKVAALQSGLDQMQHAVLGVLGQVIAFLQKLNTR